MNKKKFFKKYGLFLGISSAIVAIPTISSVVTANRTTTENVSNSINDNSKIPSVNNYENGGTKNNETINYDDILNGANKASFEKPVYAFNEKNELVVPNTNESYYKNLQDTNNYVSDTLKGNYVNDIINNIPKNNSQINIDAIKNTFHDGKQKSLENSLSKFSEEQLNSVISINDNQKKWINYLIPNNNVNLNNNFLLKDFIADITDSSFNEAQNGNLNTANIVNSLSAFGINLDEEKNKFLNSDSINSLSDILNNNGAFNNVLYGGGGESASKNPSNNTSNIDIPPTNQSAEEAANTVTLKELNGYVIALLTLTSVSVAISVAQIAIDIALFMLSLCLNWYYIADSIVLGVCIALSSISIVQYVSYIEILDIDRIGGVLITTGVPEGLNIIFKKFLDKSRFDEIKKLDSYNPFIEIDNYVQELKKWKKTTQISKFVSKVEYIKYLKLSIAAGILNVVNICLDTISSFLDMYLNSLDG